MSKKGLRAWVKEKWVDIGSPKKDGKYQPCGRKSSKGGSKRKYPGNPGGKPTNVKTFAASGGLISKERRAGAAVRGFDFKGVF